MAQANSAPFRPVSTVCPQIQGLFGARTREKSCFSVRRARRFPSRKTTAWCSSPTGHLGVRPVVRHPDAQGQPCRASLDDVVRDRLEREGPSDLDRRGATAHASLIAALLHLCRVEPEDAHQRLRHVFSCFRRGPSRARGLDSESQFRKSTIDFVQQCSLTCEMTFKRLPRPAPGKGASQ